ncbi:MAG: hypothetical protein V1676_02470 [Candidatus Diapherotrites archaeon]
MQELIIIAAIIFAAIASGYVLGRMNGPIIRLVFSAGFLLYAFGPTGVCHIKGITPSAGSAIAPILGPAGWFAVLFAAVLLIYPKLKIRKFISIRQILIIAGLAILFLPMIANERAVISFWHPGIDMDEVRFAGLASFETEMFFLLHWGFISFMSLAAGLFINSKQERGWADVWGFFRITWGKVLAMFAISAICAVLFVVAAMLGTHFTQAWLPLRIIAIAAAMVIFYIIAFPLIVLTWKISISTILAAVVYIYVLSCIAVSLWKDVRARPEQQAPAL